MNIYIGIKDQEIVKRVEAEAKQRKRSVCYVVKEILKRNYKLGNGGD